MTRWLIISAAVITFGLAISVLFGSTVLTLTAVVAAACLALWLSRAVPPFVPTLLLIAFIPLLIGRVDKDLTLLRVLNWAVDPVLALFFGGFVLGVAAERYGFDKRLADIILRWTGTSYLKFLSFTIILTVFLSMWMSNIAAAALMLGCLRPVLENLESDNILRRNLLVGVALGANLGGIATPIGTGPNALAIAAISPSIPVSFFAWMTFALPLSMGMVAFCIFFLRFRVRRRKDEWRHFGGLSAAPCVKCRKPGEAAFLLVFAGTVLFWLSEPLHGISASVVSLVAASVLFLTSLLKKEDLARVDWSTLLLIAGGITLGRLLEHSGLVKVAAAGVRWDELNATLALFLLCFATATFSALMSNTATVVMLIPLAEAIIPGPSTAILIAIAASFGMPFVISTPPNAMAFGRGGVTFHDLFWPGTAIMLLGCALISLTGKQVLTLTGIP